MNVILKIFFALEYNEQYTHIFETTILVYHLHSYLYGLKGYNTVSASVGTVPWEVVAVPWILLWVESGVPEVWRDDASGAGRGTLEVGRQHYLRRRGGVPIYAGGCF